MKQLQEEKNKAKAVTRETRESGGGERKRTVKLSTIKMSKEALEIIKSTKKLAQM